MLHWNYSTDQDQVGHDILVPLREIEHNLVNLVIQLSQPLFMVVDFFQPANEIYSQIVNDFRNGRVT